MVAKKDKRLPKGVGRVPEWWMEHTPHHTLVLEDAAAQAKIETEEAEMFKRLAEHSDYVQKYGGDDFPDWDPAVDGPLGEEMTKSWESRGYYKRESDNKWVDKMGLELSGRQFTIKIPEGYVPGQGAPSTPSGYGGTTLRTPTNSGYAADEGKSWKQPEWTTKKLKATKAGKELRGLSDDELDPEEEKDLRAAMEKEKSLPELQKVFNKKKVSEQGGGDEEKGDEKVEV